MLLSYGMIELGRPNLAAISYDLFAELKQLTNARLTFPFQQFLAISERLKQETRGSLGTKKQSTQLVASNLNTTVDFSGKSSKSSAVNADLFDQYESLIAQKNEQEENMARMLNEYLARCLSMEGMLKQNRDKNREYSHMIARLTKDMASFEVKNADLVRCNQDLKLGKSQMSEELKKLQEQMNGLKSNFEKEQNDNEEAITKLQEQLKYEQVERKQVLSKLSEARLKVAEVEKGRQALEARHEEVETELEKKSEEFGKLKKEHDRVKEILSYVKSNC